MFKKLGIIHLLIGLALVVAGAMVAVVKQPAQTGSMFDQKHAAEDVAPFSAYEQGSVAEVVSESIDAVQGANYITQQLRIEFKNAALEPVTVENSVLLDKAGSVHYKVGDRVVLGKIDAPGGVLPGGDQYVIVDRYRMPALAATVAIFAVLAVVVGRRRGLTSLVGLGITGAILVLFIAPQILAGKNALAVALSASGAIVLVSMFVSHGLSRRIQIAAVSTLAALGISGALAYLFVGASQLFGFGQGDAFLLEAGYQGTINLQGVLLAGIIISVLGVLDDVTTAQTAAVEELHHTDPELTVRELYRKGLSIGREHIASLVNTLVLVYAGAALPVFLLLTMQKSQPLWVLINSEFLAEELVRSLIGSMALILAVPISTYLAAYLYGRLRKSLD